KSVQEIYELFLKTPGLPCLESENVLVEAVKQGVRNRLLGVRIGAKVYFDEAVSDVPPDSLVLRPEKAAAEKQAEAGVTAGGETTGEVPGGVVYPPGGEQAGAGAGLVSTAKEDRAEFPTPHRVTRVAIKAAVPWDKLSHIVKGVIQPLKGAGSDPEIIIEIKAESAGGFDRTTLDTRVRETLLQLGAEIKEFDVE
ncbi:MAG: ATPase, partial [Bacillota bacterium]